MAKAQKGSKSKRIKQNKCQVTLYVFKQTYYPIQFPLANHRFCMAEKRLLVVRVSLQHFIRALGRVTIPRQAQIAL